MHPSMLRPRFFPLQRLASREEPLSSGGIPAHRLGCVPRVSHPLDALLPPRPARLVSSRFRSWGSPSRLAPHAVPYALSSAGPLGFLARPSRAPPPLQGSSTPRGSCTRTWGLARGPRRCLLGFGHFEASCIDRLQTELPVHIPSRASPGRPRADRPVGAPGFLPTDAQPLSLEIGMPPWGFAPRR
jgi:hypothetical protein